MVQQECCIFGEYPPHHYSSYGTGELSNCVTLPWSSHVLKMSPISGDASTLSGVTKLRMYLEKLWIREGEDVTVKIFLAYDTPNISFNSVEFATAGNDLDGAGSVSCIQASTASRAEY